MECKRRESRTEKEKSAYIVVVGAVSERTLRSDVIMTPAVVKARAQVSCVENVWYRRGSLTVAQVGHMKLWQLATTNSINIVKQSFEIRRQKMNLKSASLSQS